MLEGAGVEKYSNLQLEELKPYNHNIIVYRKAEIKSGNPRNKERKQNSHPDLATGQLY